MYLLNVFSNLWIIATALTKRRPNSGTSFYYEIENWRIEMNLRGHCFVHWNRSRNWIYGISNSENGAWSSILITRTQVSNDQPGMETNNVLQPLCNVAPLSRTTLTGSHMSARHLSDAQLITLGSELSQVQGIHFGMRFLSQFDLGNTFWGPTLGPARCSILGWRSNKKNSVPVLREIPGNEIVHSPHCCPGDLARSWQESPLPWTCLLNIWSMVECALCGAHGILPLGWWAGGRCIPLEFSKPCSYDMTSPPWECLRVPLKVNIQPSYHLPIIYQ